MAQAERELEGRRAHCEKQVQLARVRVAELEERVRRAEADGDEMSARLTLVELQKAEAEAERDAAQEQLSSMERKGELEEELVRLREESAEMSALKHTVVVLAKELKRRMAEEGATAEEMNAVREATGKWMTEELSSPEDTDYVTDSRSGSDTD